MFGLGSQEIVLLGLFAAAIAGIVFIVFLGTSKSSANKKDRLAELEAENRRLREELDRHRSQMEVPGV